MQKLTRLQRTQSRFFVHRRTRWVGHDIANTATKRITAIAMETTFAVDLMSTTLLIAPGATSARSTMSALTTVWTAVNECAVVKIGEYYV